ncbi:MAG: hypothetical protein ABSE22_16460 [Xanthobacteraceae bacterium]
MKKAAIATLAIAAVMATAATAKSIHHRRASHPVAEARQQNHIACTVLGCIPVPPECGQTYGRTRGGIPTGYDVILCPPGVWPLR